MSTFGEELKRERELRKITLREVSEATKINLRYLDALERNEFRHLPGGVFNKGFVRAYAQFIGVDPDTMVNSYLLEEQAQDRDRPAHPPELLRGQVSSEPEVPEAAGKTGRPGLKIALLVLALLTVGAIVTAGLVFLRGGRSPEAPETALPLGSDTQVEQPALRRSEPATDNAATQQPATDNAATQQPATDNAATRQPATDNAATQQPATDNAATRQPATDNAATQQPATDNAATQQPATDNAQRVDSEPQDPAAPVPVVEQPEPVALKSDPAVEQPAPTGEPATAQPDPGTIRARVVVERAISGRLNCDNRRVEVLDGLPAGTVLDLECRQFLLLDANDGGGLRLGLSGAEPSALAADGVPVEGYRLVPPAPDHGAAGARS